MKEAALKDNILKKLVPDSDGLMSSPDSEILALEFKTTEYIIAYLVDLMAEDGYVSAMKTSGNTSPLSGRIVSITNKGMAFLEFGGYKKKKSREDLADVWSITKIVAGVLNALLVLAVACWGVTTQIEANNKQNPKGDGNKNLPVILSEPAKSADSLKPNYTVIKQSTKQDSTIEEVNK